MAVGQILVDNGKKIMLDRIFNSSPTRGQPSQFKAGTGTNTPVSSDTDLQTPVSLDGDNFKGFVSGYPSLDFTAFSSEIRAILLTTEANGNTLTEFGLVNSDGTPLLFMRSVFTGFTKNNTTQVTFVQKMRFS